MCHVSGVMCHKSHVIYKKKVKEKVVELVGGGSLINNIFLGWQPLSLKENIRPLDTNNQNTPKQLCYKVQDKIKK